MDLTVLIMYVIWALSGLFSIVVGAALLTYVRRTWQLIRADSEDSIQAQILDSLDQVQTQLYAMSERMERLEGQLKDGDEEVPPQIPPAP